MLNAFSRRSRREIITRLAVSNNSSRANYDAKSASSSWNISKPISISADWAIALNAEAPPSNGKYRDSTVVERLLLQPTSEFDVQTPFVLKVQRYGWGYGTRSGTTWFSIIILLIHVVLALVHFSYSLAFFFDQRNGWTSSAQGSIGELVAPAITSPPANKLKNSGAGFYRPRTRMTKLRIREASSDPDRGELVAGITGGKMMPGENLLKTRKEYYAWRPERIICELRAHQSGLCYIAEGKPRDVQKNQGINRQCFNVPHHFFQVVSQNMNLALGYADYEEISSV
ncbi:hypothetical protein F4823DRAFT_640152 [Ustulina deusta]|nr:hypothetical protein F4823DRAFT_640152 [Ustulina deusta]